MIVLWLDVVRQQVLREEGDHFRHQLIELLHFRLVGHEAHQEQPMAVSGHVL